MAYIMMYPLHRNEKQQVYRKTIPQKFQRIRSKSFGKAMAKPEKKTHVGEFFTFSLE